MTKVMFNSETLGKVKEREAGVTFSMACDGTLAFFFLPPELDSPVAPPRSPTTQLRGDGVPTPTQMPLHLMPLLGARAAAILPRLLSATSPQPTPPPPHIVAGLYVSMATAKGAGVRPESLC